MTAFHKPEDYPSQPFLEVEEDGSTEMSADEMEMAAMRITIKYQGEIKHNGTKD